MADASTRQSTGRCRRRPPKYLPFDYDDGERHRRGRPVFWFYVASSSRSISELSQRGWEDPLVRRHAARPPPSDYTSRPVTSAAQRRGASWATDASTRRGRCRRRPPKYLPFDGEDGRGRGAGGCRKRRCAAVAGCAHDQRHPRRRGEEKPPAAPAVLWRAQAQGEVVGRGHMSRGAYLAPPVAWPTVPPSRTDVVRHARRRRVVADGSRFGAA